MHILIKKVFPALFVLTCLFQAPCLLKAQSDRGRISGVAYDSSGAIMGGAAVRVLNPQTEAVRQTVTDEKGFYLVDGLLPASYNVVGSVAGFGDVTVSGPLPLAYARESPIQAVSEPVDEKKQDGTQHRERTPASGVIADSRQGRSQKSEHGQMIGTDPDRHPVRQPQKSLLFQRRQQAVLLTGGGFKGSIIFENHTVFPSLSRITQ